MWRGYAEQLVLPGMPVRCSETATLAGRVFVCTAGAHAPGRHYFVKPAAPRRGC